MQFLYIIGIVYVPVPVVHFFEAHSGDDPCIFAGRSTKIKPGDRFSFGHCAALLSECRFRLAASKQPRQVLQKSPPVPAASLDGTSPGDQSATAHQPAPPPVPVRTFRANPVTSHLY